MSHAIDRAAQAVIVLILAGILIVLPPGVAGTGEAAAEPGHFQLAQAAGAPQKTPAKPPAAAPAPGNGIDGQIADLQKKLRITAAQQPQFDAFAQVMRQNAEAMDAVMRSQEQKRGTTAVDELRASAQLAEAEAEGLKRLLPALQSLYDSLADPQKRAADSVLGPPAQGSEPQPARPKK
jgi:periplasmic protein CpxP/Spy